MERSGEKVRPRADCKTIIIIILIFSCVSNMCRVHILQCMYRYLYMYTVNGKWVSIRGHNQIEYAMLHNRSMSSEQSVTTDYESQF